METGLEAESPRGRVLLLERLEENPELMNDAAAMFLDDCLGCRACEEVCPAHVPTAHMVEEWRAKEAYWPDEVGPEGFAVFRRISGPLSFFFGSARGLAWFQRLVRWSHWPVIGQWVSHLRFVPESARTLSEGLPHRVPKSLSRIRRGNPPAAPTDKAMLFVGCIMDTIYAETNHHTQDLLQLGEVEVVVPQRQRCCGALHKHGGAPEVARRWAQENIMAFEESGASTVVVNAAGCGAMMKEYSNLFEKEDPWYARACRLEEAVVDATAYLASLPLPDGAPQGAEITVHDPCHLAHGQGIRQEPRQLLKRAGYHIQEMPDSDLCCGSAGIYNLTHPAMAQSLQKRKVESVPEGIGQVAAANPGCLMHIQAGLRKQSGTVEAVHPVDLVWEAYHRQGVV